MPCQLPVDIGSNCVAARNVNHLSFWAFCHVAERYTTTSDLLKAIESRRQDAALIMATRRDDMDQMGAVLCDMDNAALCSFWA